MALISTRKAKLLAPSFVLAPERYDPRRMLGIADDSLALGELVVTVRKVVNPAAKLGPCLVLDTSDAREGIIIGYKKHVRDIGSAKKSLKPGEIIVSRLRPYLRQVAFVDNNIPNMHGATLLCSTEFFVMRGVDERSIAFLVPFLLSNRVQGVLAASQEGGHHPRFDESTLLTLPVPRKLIQDRDSDSATIEEAVRLYRQSAHAVSGLIAGIDKALGEAT